MKVNVVSMIVIFLLRVYQKLFSFDHGLPGKLFPGFRVCIFYPSCSEYSIQAIQKYGAIKGGWMGIRRVLRCGPWSYNAEKLDPVP